MNSSFGPTVVGKSQERHLIQPGISDSPEETILELIQEKWYLRQRGWQKQGLEARNCQQEVCVGSEEDHG